MYVFKLPDVGEGLHEATIANWLVAPGDRVTLDQPLVEIETDKALVQIPAPVAGVIHELSVAQGLTAQVGDVLVTIQTETTDTPAPATTGRAESAGRPQQPRSPAATPARPLDARVLAAPAVRKQALQLGIDLRQVRGSAAGGRVTLDDLQRFRSQAAVPPAVAPAAASAAAPAAAPQSDDRAEAVEVLPLAGLRKRIAERMTEAWRVPHVTSFEDVAVKRLVKLRRRLNSTPLDPDLASRERLGVLPFIVKATAQALREHPDFNASLDIAGQRIVRHRAIHIGIATALDQGLLVPVLRHAERLSLPELQRELDRLTALARKRQLAPEALSGSTFTITNFGSLGETGGVGTPIINPPESAILGCGRIVERPLVVGGALKVQPVLPLALSFDHRLHDGAGAAQFLGRIRTLLNDPARLLLVLK